MLSTSPVGVHEIQAFLFSLHIGKLAKQQE